MLMTTKATNYVYTMHIYLQIQVATQQNIHSCILHPIYEYSLLQTKCNEIDLVELY